MIVTKKALPRRAVLRGIGATVSLPLLDAMAPALTALSRTQAKPVNRLGVVYLPNGINMKQWTPATEGAGFEFSPSLQPLVPFRDRLVVLTGLDGVKGGGAHTGASTRFLTGTIGRLGSVIAGISVDQLAAKQLGGHTQLASLELALESSETGTCGSEGLSCAYLNTLSWGSPTTPLPMENNPRKVFERLFGDSGSTDRTARSMRLQKDRSILDSITEKVADLEQNLGSADRAKLDQYLEAIRDVERRIQKTQEQVAREMPQVDQPTGIPTSFEEHAGLMFDLQVLAYQADLTRVITFMVGREFSGRSYPQIGVPDAHHPTSHHQGDIEKLVKIAKIDTYHASVFASYVEKLRSTSDGDGSLLDHVTIIYGAGMSDGNAHSPLNLPILLLGGGAGQLKGGRHLHYPIGTPLANLHVTLLDKLGVPVEKLGDSTGRLEELADL